MAEETKELQMEQAKKQELLEGDAERTRSRLVFVPRVDIYEGNDAIVVLADMPGVAPEAVDITLESNVLNINGYVTPQYPEGYSLAWAEYRIGDYQRSFTLSEEIDQERIEATVKDGVLRLVLPKATPTTRKIAIKGA
ncbi:MAG: Hsp20/alpha crystallin family protein [Chloroflexi bacterium]|nr:Hsp20/alpha crystallin family protein [Anaerolineae bacterium]NMC00809.1 Hsp20/alpha crystallin family protein [Chloroflexota bacterium]HOV49350.1 Hsp20/alpha crystallin family protein [Anaerolineae bacterium]HPD41620.1 Hsp20/alpha crystallin family protein [Anaerolineae bacterium]HRT31291.1 Hsp20/alpha crystallin family protein [Anaerolineae bacterium]